MDTELIARIETHLMTAPGEDGWFREADLVAAFSLSDDRFLRADGAEPGPLSRCTIFSGRGVKHLSRATPDEIRRCQDRIRKTHTSAAHRLQWLEEGLSRLRDGGFERFTGQKVIP